MAVAATTAVVENTKSTYKTISHIMLMFARLVHSTWLFKTIKIQSKNIAHWASTICVSHSLTHSLTRSLGNVFLAFLSCSLVLSFSIVSHIVHTRSQYCMYVVLYPHVECFSCIYIITFSAPISLVTLCCYIVVSF